MCGALGREERKHFVKRGENSFRRFLHRRKIVALGQGDGSPAVARGITLEEFLPTRKGARAPVCGQRLHGAIKERLSRLALS